MRRGASARRGGSARLLTGVGAVAAITAGAAVPAVAATAGVETAGWDWVEVHDTGLGVSDAVAFHRDVLGSGIDLKGWTEDAFDAYESVNGYLSTIGFEHADPALSGVLLPVPVTFEVAPAGGATIVSQVQDYDLGGGASLDAVVTLEIRGSFARWTIELDDGGSGLIENVWGTGELGSPTDAAAVGADGLVVTGPAGLGPVLGFHVDSDGPVNEIDGSDPEFPTFVAHGASTVVYTAALLEYDPCAQDDAAAEMAALVPDLGAHFGDDLDPVLSQCVTIEAPADLKVGSPTDQLLTMTLSGALAGGHPRLDGESYFDYLDLWTSGVGVLAPDLPAGLSVEVVEDPDTQLPALRLSGTPIVAAQQEVPVRLYGIREDPDFAGEMPVAATVLVEVDSFDLTAPSPAAPTPAGVPAADPASGELAASGVGPEALVGVAVASVAVAAGLLLIVRSSRRASGRRG